MGTYTFRNKNTNEEFDLTFSIAEKDQYLACNPNIEQIIVKAPSIGDPMRLGIMKPSKDFRERLREIKRSHRGSTIDSGNITEV